MINIVIFGAPGSGKGTQSKEIIDRYGFEHVATGDLLRSEIKEKTSLGLIAKKYLDNGQLVPDDLIIEMIEQIIDRHRNAGGIVFDGFPRTVPQAQALSMMLRRHSADVTIVLDLNVPEEILIERILERGKASGRTDDNLDTVRKRLAVYYSQTAPIANFYKELGILCPITGTGTVAEIADRIASAIDNLS